MRPLIFQLLRLPVEEKSNVTTPAHISSAENSNSTNLLDVAQSNPQSHETTDLSVTEDASAESTNLFANPQSSGIVDLINSEDVSAWETERNIFTTHYQCREYQKC